LISTFWEEITMTTKLQDVANQAVLLAGVNPTTKRPR